MITVKATASVAPKGAVYFTQKEKFDHFVQRVEVYLFNFLAETAIYVYQRGRATSHHNSQGNQSAA